MGVFRLTSLLRSHGLHPPDSGRRRRHHRPLAGRKINDIPDGDSFYVGGDNNLSLYEFDQDEGLVQILPPLSTMVVDGPGLAFHLYRIAYVHHHFELVGGYSDRECGRTNVLTAEVAAALLPPLLSLSAFDEVVDEFVSALVRRHRLTLRIYFDGPGRRMKMEEDSRRQDKRDEYWANLRRFCLTGALPSGGVRRGSGAFGAAPGDFLEAFPIPTLLMDQFRSCLDRWRDVSGGSVEIVQCDEEADSFMAQASATDVSGRTYVLGSDSDFLTYGGGVKYVPLDGLGISGPVVYGTVLSRADVARCLGLPDESAVVELSILLGNDFTRHHMSDRDSYEGKNEPAAILAHLVEKGSGYRVTSTKAEAERSFQFTRTLLEFRTVSGYTLENDKQGPGIKDKHTSGNLNPLPRSKPSIPAGLDLSLSKMACTDPSILFSILRPFLAFLEAGGDTKDYDSLTDVDGNREMRIGQRHIDALKTVLNEKCNRIGNKCSYQVAQMPSRIPDWNDVQVAYAIERCISVAFKSRHDLPTFFNFSPCQIFDQSTYLMTLENSIYEDLSLAGEVVASKQEKSFLDEFITRSTSEMGLVSGCNEEEETEDNYAVTVHRTVLPIDEYEESILKTVKEQRVTIIHGETGCGKVNEFCRSISFYPVNIATYFSKVKISFSNSLLYRISATLQMKSSRVPIMLLRGPPPDPGMGTVKMFVSQPRRIAAKTLVERVRSTEPDLRDLFALRMGHGVREYETSATQVWFVTTGYLCRLMANYPETFDSHTHLIIDEVHERSVDTDVLCLLCRRLLASHPSLRLILMSATMAASLYRQYFGSPELPLRIRARRFPVREYFVEDLQDLLSPREARIAVEVYKDCETGRCQSPPNAKYMRNLHQLAVEVAMSVGRHNSSVLIFVPGMSDIIAITDLIQRLNVPGVAYNCFPIHSDVPFEEQLSAFNLPGLGEVKIVIATNAAESSITLPDVDHVICTGLCKQIVYNSMSHRQMLVPCWISRSSATQRAGRTGRVREGNVYRLYSRNVFEGYMEDYEAGEMVRIPLDSVILSLREMVKEEVTTTLLQCIEPPDMTNIQKSFQSLHQSNFITQPNDQGEITPLGSLVVALGVDHTFGALIGLGIQFGVAAETIEMAGVLSSPRTPWLMSNPLYHEAQKYNEIISKTFVSRSHFDANLYSEPFAAMNLLWDYHKSSNKKKFCRLYHVSYLRLKRVIATIDNLRIRVAKQLGSHPDALRISMPPVHMPHSKLTILRILQVWVFPHSIIECVPAGTAHTLTLGGARVEEQHFEQVLDRNRHPFSIVSENALEYTGHFTPVKDGPFVKADFFMDLECRLVSFACELECSFFWFSSDTDLLLFVSIDLIKIKQIQNVISGGKQCGHLSAERTGSSLRRGRKGRSCGLWSITYGKVDAIGTQHKAFVKIAYQLEPSLIQHLRQSCRRIARDVECLDEFLSLDFDNDTLNKGKSIKFSLKSEKLNKNVEKVSRTDICDILSTPDVYFDTRETTSQTATFSSKHNTPLSFSDQDIFQGTADTRNRQLSCITGEHRNTSSWQRPLLNDIPEGVRLLSAIASGRRKDHFISFSAPHQGIDVGSEERKNSCVNVHLCRSESKISSRWRRCGTSKPVYVPEDCIPSGAVSTKSIFACCANMLELRGGAAQVEGLTLLPSGPKFLLLSLLCFGLDPFPYGIVEEEEEENNNMACCAPGADKLLQIEDRMQLNGNEASNTMILFEERMELALEFNETYKYLGEELVCRKEMIYGLCKIFDGVDGYLAKPWDDLAGSIP